MGLWPIWELVNFDFLSYAEPLMTERNFSRERDRNQLLQQRRLSGLQEQSRGARQTLSIVTHTTYDLIDKMALTHQRRSQI